MLLAAHGALKPLSASDPLWSNVVFLQTFDGIADNTVLSDPFPSLKTGVSYFSDFANRYTVRPSIARFGKSAQNTSANDARIYITLSGNFTFECSAYYTGAGGHTFLAVQTTAGFAAIFSISSGNLLISCTDGGTNYNGPALSANTWYDAAVSWDGTALRCFWDGVLLHTSTKLNPATNFRPSSSTTANLVYTDDVRITAACRYTSSYTPSHPFPAA